LWRRGNTACIAVVLLLLVASSADAQNIIGTRQLDVGRSRLVPTLDSYRLTLDHRLTVRLSGNTVLDTA
jgi:hypothetical protein